MSDALIISTLAITIINSLSQFYQMYCDYKKAELEGHSHIYKTYNSECCVSIKEEKEKEENE